MELKPYDPQGQDVLFQKAPIAFPAFDYYRQQAVKMAEYINSIELTEDNVQSVKKDLASVRKVTDELSKRRIAIKKTILEDFDVFESEVRELSGIISEAENNLRSKVKDLEEKEREVKEKKILEIWNKRAPLYQIYNLLQDAFRRWLTPQHLNKSVTLKKVESDMTDWLENTEREITAIRSMGDEYLVEYLVTLDMSEAIDEVNRRHEIRETINDTEPEEEECTAVFIIKGEKEIKLTELLLKENNIEFIRR